MYVFVYVTCMTDDCCETNTHVWALRIHLDSERKKLKCRRGQRVYKNATDLGNSAYDLPKANGL